MSARIDGGPAFPAPSKDGENPVFTTTPGMSLRDYFAAKAMVGMLSHPFRGDDEGRLVRDVYMVADRMLREREKAPFAVPR